MKSRVIVRKQLLTFSLVIALGLAVFVNWYYTKPQGSTIEPEVTDEANLGDAQYVNSNSVETENYFESAEINRKKAHDTAKDYLSTIVSDTTVDEDTKASAREKLTKISNQIKIENDIENLISAQTGSKCLVTYDDNSIEVILPKGIVSDAIAIKIKDIIISKTKLTADKITIIELK
ncbi:MAG: SpoIIIAH-like family protein [Clostridia bacterium]|nr:SpoIIIAH-like family protein [Clostridia bacterium]